MSYKDSIKKRKYIRILTQYLVGIFKQTMKLEILEKDRYYHIYNRGIDGCDIFLSDNNKSYFLKLVDKYLSSQVTIFAHCLMDNHYHFVIKINENEKDVVQSLSNLFNAYAKAFNKQNNRTGSLFEKQFKRIII